MSNPENFIDEVTEEVRRDRLFGFFRRYGWIPVLFVLLLVVGAAVWEWRRSQHRESAQDFGDDLIAALENPDRAARTAAISAIDATGDRGAVLRLVESADALAANDRPAALKALEAVSGNATLPQSYRDLADLKRVTIGGGTIPAADRQAILDRLARPGAAFRPLALEQLALARVETGDRDGAIAALKALLEEPDVTPGLRRRATQVIVALGGQAG